MLNKALSPVIGKFAGAWSSGNWAGLSDPNTSPRSPLDFDSQSPTRSPSPRGIKNYHLGGIGLGIVVEMEKSGEDISTNQTVFRQSLNDPNPDRLKEKIEVDDDLEDYTFVTYHCPNKSHTTRVYCDESRKRRNNNDRVAIFFIAPPRFEDTQFPPFGFLKSCNLCKKKLHGKDIYMYRGEKGFCSNECRYQQITMDERNKH